VTRAHGQRPIRNGSSNTTFDIIVALSVLGASALTLLAVLRPGRARSDGDDEPHESKDGEDHDD
jgi:hypothetical protein